MWPRSVQSEESPGLCWIYLGKKSTPSAHQKHWKTELRDGTRGTLNFGHVIGVAESSLKPAEFFYHVRQSISPPVALAGLTSFKPTES